MKKRHVTAVIQARMGSSRLPGKTLKPLYQGKPVLQLMLERVKRAQLVDEIVVATSIEKQDDALETFCQQENVRCFRGSENDVLDRFYQAAATIPDADIIIRLTADCPMHDPELLDRVVRFFMSENLEFGSNVDPPTFPDGLDTEVMTYTALQAAWSEARQQEEREHVTTFFKRNTDRFKQKTLTNDVDLSSHHWTLDTESDFKFVQHIYDVFYDKKPDFSMHDVLTYLAENPDAQSVTDGWTHLIR